MSASPGSITTGSLKANPALGIGLMLFACFTVIGGSTLSKSLMLVYPVMLLLFIRNFAVLAMLVPFTRASDIIAAPRPKLQALRFFLAAIEAPMYFFSLAYMPIVDLTTFYLAPPIYVTAIAAIFLRERVGWRRWSAVFVGFIGVLIAMRPSAAMLSWPALLPLCGSILYSAILSITRELRGTSDRVLMLSQIFAVFLFAAVMVAVRPENWVMPAPLDGLLFACLGMGSLISAFCINRSLKLAPASVVVPYQYALILWAALFGYLFFGETPQLTTIIGGAIIIASGIYIFMREQVRGKENKPPIETPV